MESLSPKRHKVSTLRQILKEKGFLREDGGNSFATKSSFLDPSRPSLLLRLMPSGHAAVSGVKQIPHEQRHIRGKRATAERWPTVVGATLIVHAKRFVINFGATRIGGKHKFCANAGGLQQPEWPQQRHKCRENFALAQAVRFRKDIDGHCQTSSNCTIPQRH